MRKDGQYEVKILDPRTGRRKSFYSSVSKDDAKAKARLEIEQGEDLLTYYTGTYLPSVAHRSTGYVTGIGKSMDKHVLPVFGSFPLERISRADLQRFFNRLVSTPQGKQKRPLEISTVRLVKKHFSGVMNLAWIDGIVQGNAVKFVRLPETPFSEKEPLTLGQCSKLLHEPGSHRNAVCLGLMGLRAGEICAASWADLENGLLHVRSQIVKDARGKWVPTDVLKTPQSNRLVPIPHRYLKLMSKDSVLIVGGNPAQLWRDLKALAVSLEIDDFSPHVMRHTFISILENELECPRRIVAQIAGKAKKGEMDRYSKASLESRKAWADKYAETTTTQITTQALSQAL